MEVPSIAQKPKAVVTAVALLWVSLAVGLVEMLRDLSNLSGVPSDFASYLLISSFALIVLLIFNISAGRNWARITLLVLFVLGTLPNLPLMLDGFSRSVIGGTLSVVQFSLKAYALFLLFTLPGSQWFRKVAPD